MKVKEFLLLYQQDNLVQGLGSLLKQDPGQRVFTKGLSGSIDAVIMAALWQKQPQTWLVVCEDREEAAYVMNDLQALLESNHHILFFPTSHRKPYQFETVENANVLQRADALSRLNARQKNDEQLIVITYPEALTEKVINRKSLVTNTFTAKVGEKIDITFLTELLLSYDFERSDFVFEPGQFSVRGGIIDVFSYSGELPYRIELFGDEIETIRTFDPENQLSREQVKVMNIVPNVQTRLLQESRESFASFLPSDAVIWLKNAPLTWEVVDKAFEKASELYDGLKSQQGPEIVHSPELLFEHGKSLKGALEKFTIVEFGSKSQYRSAEVIPFDTRPQPSFNKDHNLLVRTLRQWQEAGYADVLCAEQPKNLERLQTIFDELDKELRVQQLYVSLRQGFEDHHHRIICYTDHQIFDRFHKVKEKERYSKSKSLTLRELKTLQAGDFVTHIDHGIARFAGLERVEIGGRPQEAVRLIYRDDDMMLVSIHSLHKISKYSGKEMEAPSLSKLGSPEWENKKSRVKKKVRDIAKELISLYAKRKAMPGFGFSPDSYLQAELESSFFYEDTPDQAKATADTKKDMEKPHPMDRLVCGDVGFGKTEVAMRAAFKSVADSKQVAVLVPTTILAMQHAKTFKERFKNFPVTVEYINRFKSDKEQKEILKKLGEGKIDILIGTHRIASKDIKFKDLGLLVIDEEQKFGVKTKDKLKEMRANVDVLTLSATPIPRTLQFSLMGARDLSIIATPPTNRQPVTTEVTSFSEALIRDAVALELARGGQVFIVHNRVQSLHEIGNIVLKLVPDARVSVAHGQMEASQLENVMLKFIEGELDVLVSTNIIESGLDIPNANTILINNAHMFGMSDLHQMRGRVGRSNRKAFCYLMVPSLNALTSDGRKRLQTLEEFNELGDGFKVAMRDLDIRGAGDVLGAEQSGFINDIGFDAYHKVLDEAITELKEGEFRSLFELEAFSPEAPMPVKDTQFETDLELLIPESYVTNISERLSLYGRLDSLKAETELQEFLTQLLDRFGPLPKQVETLAETVRLRWVAQGIGFERLTLKDSTLRGTFPPAENAGYFQSDTFGTVIKFVQQHAKVCRIKELKGKLVLIIENIKTISDAGVLLQQLAAELQNQPQLS